jgi:hypothetical protein
MFSTSKTLFCTAAAALTLLGSAAQAQLSIPSDMPLIDPPVAGAAPRKIALVSAVGSILHVVNAKQQAGSRLDPFERQELVMPGQTLNNTVLRGMDKAVSRVDATAQRILLHVSPPDLSKTIDSKKAKETADDLLDKITDFEDRKNWDLIIAATPRYAHVGTDRMGDRLWGLGLYVQALVSADLGNIAGMATFAQATDDEVISESKTYSQMSTFVAPYAYLRFTVFDAKTLRVLKTIDKMEARKTGDSECEGVAIFKCYTPKQYASMIDRLTERTALAAVAGRAGSVTASEPKLVEQPAAK